jgi:rhodanese-related sulfurtransferase
MTLTGKNRSLPLWSTVLIALTISISSLRAVADIPEPSDNPDSPAVAVSIDSENLVELYRSLPNMRIIDVRHHEDYVQGHIETARNLPLAEADSAALDKLAKSAEQAMVLYCNGNAGDASIKAIQIASGCGYKRLFWLRGGVVEWRDKDYPYVID